MNDDRKRILGFDLGGTKCAVSLADKGANVLNRVEFATKKPQVTLNDLADAAARILGEARVQTGDLIGIGISAGGPLDSSSGVILGPPNMPEWSHVPIKSFLEQRFQVEARLENDANAGAIAEYRLGVGRGTANMAFLTWGTGIGAGLILNGALYRGRDGLAGEVGHTALVIDGPLCACGKRGCLEALACGPAIARSAGEDLRFHPESALASMEAEAITARDVVDAAREGDTFARLVLEEAGSYMGIGIANLLQSLNLEVVALGTVAVHAGDLVMAPLRRALQLHTWPRIHEDVRVVPSDLGDRVQDLAAISLWLEELNV